MLPYPMGNTHPRFWSWYMGAGNFTGALDDFLAAVHGSNLGGGSHAAALVDQQVVSWLRDMVGLPPTAGGTLVNGGSMANPFSILRDHGRSEAFAEAERLRDIVKRHGAKGEWAAAAAHSPTTGAAKAPGMPRVRSAAPPSRKD